MHSEDTILRPHDAAQPRGRGESSLEEGKNAQKLSKYSSLRRERQSKRGGKREKGRTLNGFKNLLDNLG